MDNAWQSSSTELPKQSSLVRTFPFSHKQSASLCYHLNKPIPRSTSMVIVKNDYLFCAPNSEPVPYIVSPRMMDHIDECVRLVVISRIKLTVLGTCIGLSPSSELKLCCVRFHANLFCS